LADLDIFLFVVEVLISLPQLVQYLKLLFI